ncbi:hypothetical protein GALMADRAFT_210510 [Galerina marginata CBS 339.88]|uniref:Uracil-DNA glycosylase-like domain-containing protein n=1 Tax=Galerina marginata (strain CBS 339.88) TaxID=685588 RepID=A0A067T2M0_GALM3|nr:hypothetical protein GALMADRAFT_210510 [Galerina marginata CBS 339.88]
MRRAIVGPDLADNFVTREGTTNRAFESRLGKRKVSIEASERGEKDKPKVRRTAVQNKSPLKASGSSKVRVYEHLRGSDNHLDVGLIPWQKSAEIGHHFGNPNNHFWSCLHEPGESAFFGVYSIQREDASLPKLCSISFYRTGSILIVAYPTQTNLTDRPTAIETELSETEQVGGVPALLNKLAQYPLRILCFVGLGIADIVKSRAFAVGTSGARKASGSKEKAVVGLQPYKMVHSELDSAGVFP